MSISRRTFLKTMGQGVVAATVVSALPSVVSAVPNGRDKTLSYFPPGTIAPSIFWVHEVSTQEEYEHALQIAGPRDMITFGPGCPKLQWVDVPEGKDGLVIRNMIFYTSGASSHSSIHVSGCLFVGQDLSRGSSVIRFHEWPKESAFINNMVYTDEKDTNPSYINATQGGSYSSCRAS